MVDTINDPKKLDKCGHTFCKECIEEAFKRIKPACPVCGVMYGRNIGNQPKDAQMKHRVERGSLPGYEGCDTIVIQYHVPNGEQMVRIYSKFRKSQILIFEKEKFGLSRVQPFQEDIQFITYNLNIKYIII